MHNSKKTGFKKKSSARRFAMQALYSWMISKNDLTVVEQHYLQERNQKNFDVEYFKLLLNNIPTKQDQIDQAIIKYSDRDLKQLDPVELSILRIASYELIFCEQIPFKVIISEALELVTMFGSETSYKFINAVLDRLAKDCREINKN